MQLRSINRRDFLQTTAFAALSAVSLGLARDPFAALAL
ncbi:MAG: twin-arginine translocation signal domain-containing protein, partial [Thermoguttaceae bacterium]|nr:twin-arginine translocation signal domain-containing protein [Thermoguttaceae bacterium]